MAGGVAPEGGDKAVLVRSSANGAKRNRIEIDLYGLFEGDVSKDMEVKAGDIIYVPRAEVFYVYGEVQRPGMFPLQRNMNVAQAISISGGLTPRGTDRWVKVKRRNSQGEIQTETVELGDMVRPDDVIYVRESWF